MADVEEKEMEDLMAKWEAENPEAAADCGSESEDDEPLHYDEMLEKFRRDVDVTNNAFDHVVLGTCDLDKAVDDFEKATGVRPLMVVSQNGLGTKSARIAFRQCAFIEFLGPDPGQPSSPMGEKLAKIPEGELQPIHYAVRNSKAEEMKKGLWSELGLEYDQVTMIAKDRGMPWQWDMYFMEGHEEGGLLPFFIDWKEYHHAAGRLPIVGDLDSVKISCDPDSKVYKLLNNVDGLELEAGGCSFEISFSTANGKQSYSGSNLMGVEFPKN